MGKVYLSVGSGLSPEQEEFVQALESLAAAAGIATHTIGRTDFSSDAPLVAVRKLMEDCDGAIVLALERLRFGSGLERPGSERQEELAETSIATSWNQIEATLAYDRNLPLLVIVDEKLRKDGMLEPNKDWYVHSLPLDSKSLESKEFIGLFRHWAKKLEQTDKSDRDVPITADDLADMTIGQWISALTPKQLVGIIGVFAAAVIAAFTLGGFLS